MEVAGLDESADPRHSEGHINGPVRHTRARHFDYERLAGRVGAGGPACPGVGFVGRHPNAGEAVAAFPEGRRADLGGVAQIVGFRQGGIGAGPEGLRRGGGGAGPNPGFDGPTGQRCAPLLECQRHPGPVEPSLLGQLVVVRLKEGGELPRAADRGIDGPITPRGPRPPAAGLTPTICCPASFRLLPSCRKNPGLFGISCCSGWVCAPAPWAVKSSAAAMAVAILVWFFFMETPVVGWEGATFHEESAMQRSSKSCCWPSFSTFVHVPKASPRSLFAARLKQARELRGIASQRALGVLMGLDKKLASSRVNRYETEVSGIDLDGLGKLADVLGVPMAYLVAEDDATAAFILALKKMTQAERRELYKKLLSSKSAD